MNAALPAKSAVENSTDSAGFIATVGNAWTKFWFTPSDAITLSLMRVLTGLVALWWYISFAGELQNWFGPGGLLPLRMAQETRANANNWAFSILDYADTSSALWAAYFAGLAAIVLFTAGLFTRITSILALIFVLSFIHRAPVIARPADDILAMLMFYLCIAPSGAHFSLDAWLRKRKSDMKEPQALAAEKSSSAQFITATLATNMLRIHVALIYAASAIAQLRGDTWWQGEAVWWIMARPESRLVDLTGLASMGMAFEYLINFCTHAIVLYEICFALLAWNRWARPVLLWLGVPVWVGLALISGAVSFAVLMLIANLAFLPPATLRAWCGKKTAA